MVYLLEYYVKFHEKADWVEPDEMLAKESEYETDMMVMWDNITFDSINTIPETDDDLFPDHPLKKYS